MKVVNGTGYDTRELRRIFCQVLRDTLRQRPSWAGDWKRHGSDFLLKVGNRRKDDFTSGHAYIGLGRIEELSRRKGWVQSHNMHLSVAKDVSVAKLAATFQHELYHAFGVREHSNFPPAVRDCEPGPFTHYPQLLGLPERLSYVEKAKKPRPTTEELQRKRIEKLRERRKAWVTKSLRAETALKKIDAALKRYERQGHDVGELRPAANRKRKSQR